MPRLARVVVPGMLHHVTQRGNRRQETFYCDADYQTYLELMAEWRREREVDIWAYCLMPNHVHLIAVPESQDAFGEELGMATRYTDLDEMLEREKPDVLHCVTDPTLRVPLMTRLSDAGVPGVIVEKPICIGADDYKALRKLDAASKTKFVVNYQLRRHPMTLDFL